MGFCRTDGHVNMRLKLATFVKLCEVATEAARMSWQADQVTTDEGEMAFDVQIPADLAMKFMAAVGEDLVARELEMKELLCERTEEALSHITKHLDSRTLWQRIVDYFKLKETRHE